MAPCPHVERLSLDQLGSRFEKESFQEDLRNKSLICSECASKSTDLRACLHCDFIGCGQQAKGHAQQHADEKANVNDPHVLWINLQSRVVWCYACNDEVMDDLDQNPLSPENAALLRDIRSMLDPSKSSDIVAEEEEGEEEEDGMDVDEEDRGRKGITKSPKGLCGLQNLGNTCYINAALQALSNCRPLTRFFLKCRPYWERNDRARLLQDYGDLIKEMWSGNKRACNPTSFVRSMWQVNSQFKGYGQQDSQEFLRCFLAALHDQMKEEFKPREEEIFDKGDAKKEESGTSSPVPSLNGSSLPQAPAPTGKEKKSKKSSKQAAALQTQVVQATQIGSQVVQATQIGNGEAEAANGDYRKMNGSTSPHSAKGDKGAAEEKKPTIVKHSVSAISDVFEGSYISEVTCSNCKKVSRKEEYFYELSVSIPGKKQRAKIISEKSSNTNNNSNSNINNSSSSSSSAPTASSAPSSKDSKSQGWFNWIPNPFSTEKSKAVTIQDCLHSYCALEDLTGDDKYKCEACKTVNEATKQLRISRLPEMLVLHIKRFRYDSYFGSKVSQHVQFPIEDLDVKPFVQAKDPKAAPSVSKYDLVAVVNHHGIINGGHYTAYAKHYATSRWHAFNDSHVSPASKDDVSKSEAYMLFYRKRTPMSVTRTRRKFTQMINDSSETYLSPMSTPKEQPFYVSNYWINKLNTFVDPGPICNSDFLCEHGAIDIRFSPSYRTRSYQDGMSDRDPSSPSPRGNQSARDSSSISSRVTPVSKAVWDQLVQAYGGGPALRDLTDCKICFCEFEAFKKQREQEKRKIQEQDTTAIGEGEFWYIIDSRWLNIWREFALEEARMVRPGPIDNSRLLLPDGRVRSGLQKAKDYRGVNKNVWDVFYSTYGGGPVIARKHLDIYSESPNGNGGDSEESEGSEFGER
mmetsp:Transcript_3430/g.5190  ORF Transcript_3430/g.5190 Transcript_3430/m.5190 type:complete len:915 (-) Transcript_3430:35-2779(-)|eukprot:CAMPEP_0184644606 /NCGR_PEP_ID=MMETSP0308-20130426/1303_1 /TAXON_ID=38269 /ORGANISM="Gloeochaete witrockiana, Strain SAG 46.84" /LENGTH=914 /DNA_ID=CAMNT_0027073237 /DNA_START=75 /DNA_END=2819 /DNA_ORIENTATION=-